MFWIVAVPNEQKADEGAKRDELARASAGNCNVFNYNIPPLKVGTLDNFVALSDDLAKADQVVEATCHRVSRAFRDLCKAEGDSKGNGSEAPELMIKNRKKHMSPKEYTTHFRWNNDRYPKRQALRSLLDTIVADVGMMDEQLKKQNSEFSEIRQTLSAMERKEQGTLLVKPLGQFVKKEHIIELPHITSLLIVVPREKEKEFLSSYELLEEQDQEKKLAQAKKEREKERERARTKKQDQFQRASSRLSAKESDMSPEHSPLGHDDDTKQIAFDSLTIDDAAAAAGVAAGEAGDSESNEAEELERRLKAEQATRASARKERMDALESSCQAAIPRSALKLTPDDYDGEYVLYRVLVLRKGEPQYKALCRERRFIVRPFKFDPKAEEAELVKKQRLQHLQFSIKNRFTSWCSLSYSEVFVAWLHVKAIRAFVEATLRFGLLTDFTAMLLEVLPGRQKKLRSVLSSLYSGLDHANLTKLEQNETDLSGLGSDFYPYIYLELNLNK